MTQRRLLFAILLPATLAAACSPTVKVEAPREPITVNLNIRIEHEVRVKVERDVEALLEQNPELFE